jgi:hypothetical protein
MDVTCVQGVTGFLAAAGGNFALSDTVIECKNDYATISVVSMDRQPLATSKKILVQAGTVARLTGWRSEAVEFEFQQQTVRGRQIMNTGHPPWLVSDTKVSLAVVNPHITQATRLDENGYAAAVVGHEREGDTIRFQLPRNTMYFVLEAK